MQADLHEVIRTLQTTARSRTALCSFVEIDAEEYGLVATRDGYINLAAALLEFVANVDSGVVKWECDGEKAMACDDGPARTLYQLASNNGSLRACYLLKEHRDVVAFLAAVAGRMSDGDMGVEHDPHLTE